MLRKTKPEDASPERAPEGIGADRRNASITREQIHQKYLEAMLHAEKTDSRITSKWIPSIVFAIGLLMTAQVWKTERGISETDLENQFDVHATEIKNRIAESKIRYEQALIGVSGFFESSDTVTKSEFHSFVRHLEIEKNYPGVLGVSYAPYVGPNSAPVQFIEPPHEKNMKVIGFDNYSDPVRKSLLESAAKSGEIVSSGKIRLMQDDGGSAPGFLMFSPIYRNEYESEKTMKKVENLLGWAAASFQVDTFIKSTLRADVSDVHISVYDGDAIEQDALLFESNPEGHVLGKRVGKHPNPLFHSVQKIDHGGRTWTIEMHSTDAFESRLDLANVNMAAFFGLSGSLAISFILWLLIRGHNRAIQAMQAGEELTQELFQSEDRYKTLFTESHVVMLVIDPDTWTIIDANKKACKYYGYTIEELRGKNITEINTLGPAEIQHEIEYAIRGERDSFRFRHRLASGEVRDVEVSTAIIGLDVGKNLISIVQDVTERKKAEKALQISEERWKFALEWSGEGVWDWDLTGDKIVYSKAWKEMLGYSEDEASDSFEAWESRIHPSDVSNVLRQIRDHLNGLSQMYHCEYRIQCKDGSWKWVEDRGMVVSKDENGRAARFVGTRSDITDRMESEEKLVKLANHDVLTGLPNRAFLTRSIETKIREAELSGKKIAFYFIDLDKFKDINDSLGHNFGDILLTQVAERMTSLLTNGNVLARQGGDEFIMVAEDTQTEAEMEALAEKILQEASRPFEVQNRELWIGASIGIAQYPKDGTDVNELLQFSDTAMYRAKASGRNTFAFFAPEMNESSIEKQFLGNALHDAIERDEMRVNLQPIVDAKTGEIASMESLIRWNLPERGSVSPAKFIPLAEENGTIVTIGKWMIRSVCEKIRKWQEQGYIVPRVAINLSARQFNQKSLVQDIAAIIRETWVAPHNIGLEITESMLMTDINDAIRTLRELNSLGIEVSIDDFGTGYSSLNYLKRLPIQKLKVDQSFVRDVILNPEDASIVSAVIAMAHSLRMKVVAEGVETKEQLDFLRERGCDFIQGYYFSKPLDFDTMETRLTKKTQVF